MGRLTTIAFHGTVGAGSRLTLRSKKITRAFTVKRVRASFALNTNRTLQLSFFVSPDPEAPSSEPPGGVNILRQLGQVEYIVGDDEVVDFPIEIKNFSRGGWIKCHGYNTDVFPHTVFALVTLEMGPPQAQ